MPSIGGVRFNSVIGVRSNRIPVVINNMQRNIRGTVLASATTIQTRASQGAPVDTGSLRESIYHSDGQSESDYTLHSSVAFGLNRDAVIVPEVNPELVIPLGGSSSGGSAADSYLMVVGSAVSHAIFNELGTVHMGARPFMYPATLAVQDDFTQAMTHIADD